MTPPTRPHASESRVKAGLPGYVTAAASNEKPLWTAASGVNPRCILGRPARKELRRCGAGLRTSVFCLEPTTLPSTWRGPMTASLKQTSQFSRSVVSDSATPWTAARQASLSITNFRTLLRLMSIHSVMPSNHLILCRPLLILPSIFPSIRVFSNELVICIRWPKYWRLHNSNDMPYKGLALVLGSPPPFLDPLACGILISWPEMNPKPLQWKQNLNYWTAKEIPWHFLFLSEYSWFTVRLCFRCTAKWISLHIHRSPLF